MAPTTEPDKRPNGYHATDHDESWHLCLINRQHTAHRYGLATCVDIHDASPGYIVPPGDNHLAHDCLKRTCQLLSQ